MADSAATACCLIFRTQTQLRWRFPSADNGKGMIMVQTTVGLQASAWRTERLSARRWAPAASGSNHGAGGWAKFGERAAAAFGTE
jgi:hypothetical protein